MKTTSSPRLRSRPKIIVSFASDALRVIAISSGSQPNSVARSRRTDSMRGSSTRHMCSDGQLVREAQVADHLLEHVRRRRAAAAVVQVDHRAVEVERALDLAPVRLVLGDADRRRRPAAMGSAWKSWRNADWRMTGSDTPAPSIEETNDRRVVMTDDPTILVAGSRPVERALKELGAREGHSRRQRQSSAPGERRIALSLPLPPDD